MRPVTHGYVVYAPHALHVEYPQWSPGWGATAVLARANARIPEDVKARVKQAARAPWWVWVKITPDIPWAELRARLRLVGDRRVGRFVYAEGGVYDILAHLAPSLRGLPEDQGALSFFELPDPVRRTALDELAALGFVEETARQAQMINDRWNMTNEERYVEWLRRADEALGRTEPT